MTGDADPGRLPVRVLPSSGRAQAGIGTLIILIAALLIAAMAAGVFFETAGVLEGQTQETSDDVSGQLNGRIDVIVVSGQVQDGEIEVVNLTVKSGGTVDLREVTIQWLGPSTTETLVWAGSDSDGPTFGVTMVEGDDDWVLDEDTDRAVLTIDPGTGINATTTIDGETVDIEETGPPLQENDEVTVNVVTDSQTTYDIRVPQSLGSSGTVEL